MRMEQDGQFFGDVMVLGWSPSVVRPRPHMYGHVAVPLWPGGGQKVGNVYFGGAGKKVCERWPGHEVYGATKNGAARALRAARGGPCIRVGLGGRRNARNCI